MKTYISLMKITTSAPDAALEHTGRFTRDGEAILRKALIYVPSGSFVTPRDEAEETWFLSCKAIREMSPSEALTWADMQPAGDFA